MDKRHFAIGVAVILQAAAAAGERTTPPHRLGDHPAVVVQRLESRRGYDYASKFYPHPAWLYLRAQPTEAEAAAEQRREVAEEPSRTAGASNEAPKAQVSQ